MNVLLPPCEATSVVALCRRRRVVSAIVIALQLDFNQIVHWLQVLRRYAGLSASAAGRRGGRSARGRAAGAAGRRS